MTTRRAMIAAGVATALTAASAKAGVRTEFHLWCRCYSHPHDDPKTVYYSSVFFGDYDDSRRFESAFQASVERRYGEMSFASCHFGWTRQDATEESRGRMRDDEIDGWEVVRTGWSGAGL